MKNITTTDKIIDCQKLAVGIGDIVNGAMIGHNINNQGIFEWAYPLIFQGKQLELWYALSFDKYQTTKEISQKTNIASKNVSIQLAQMSKNTNLIAYTIKGKLKSWLKLPSPFAAIKQEVEAATLKVLKRVDMKLGEHSIVPKEFNVSNQVILKNQHELFLWIKQNITFFEPTAYINILEARNSFQIFLTGGSKNG